jgi:hypothetical protein
LPQVRNAARTSLPRWAIESGGRRSQHQERRFIKGVHPNMPRAARSSKHIRPLVGLAAAGVVGVPVLGIAGTAQADDTIPTTQPTPGPTDTTQNETPSTQPSTDVTGDVAGVQGAPGATLPSTDGLPAATTATTDSAAPIAIVIFGGSLLAMTGLVLRRKASSTNS